MIRRHHDLMQLPDGSTVSIADKVSRIEHVELSSETYLRSMRLPRDTHAIILAIHVVPPTPRGELIVTYFDRTVLRAPTRAMEARYHGLTRARQLQKRLQLLVDPTVTVPQEDTFLPPLLLPFQLREGLQFDLEFRRTPTPNGTTVTVELQYLITDNADGTPLFWDTGDAT